MASRFAGTFAVLFVLAAGVASIDSAGARPLWVTVPPSPPPLTGSLPAHVAATIPALQALGDSATAAGIAYVENYAHPNDNGGGTFVWLPTATGQPDNCLTFAAKGLAAGLWQRQLNGVPFNADMCGTGNADDTAAIQAAFEICAKEQLQLIFSARVYKLSAGLDVPATCAFHGVGRYGYFGAPATTFDFRGAPASAATLMRIIGDPKFGNYSGGATFGGFQIMDGYQVPRTAGLYISRISGVHAEDIAVYNVMGTGIRLGQEIESTYRGLYVSGSGSPGNAELDIDGESHDGQEYSSTTTSIYDSYVEFAGKLGAPCGIAINRNALLTISGGASEANGNLICVANKGGVTALSIEHFDMEQPAPRSVCVAVGGDWPGAPGHAVRGMRLIGNSCIPSQAPGAAAFRIGNTDGFLAEGNFVNSFANQTYFDIVGANTNMTLGRNGNDGNPTAYVTVGGKPRGDAILGRIWSVDSVDVRPRQ